MRCGKQREATVPVQSLVKLQPWFLSLRWKTCLWQNCSLDSCACSEEPTIGQNTWCWWWLWWYFLTALVSSTDFIVFFLYYLFYFSNKRNWWLLLKLFLCLLFFFSKHSSQLFFFFHRARWLRGIARDSHLGGPGFKSRCQPTWLRFFRGFPQSSRQMLGWIFITTIHLTIIHQIHVS